ncbi:hypothetical protein DRP53_03545 [candidate division WOR-3 bacterium]|uniref:Rrf2 family transcriptional regulator n=1 Tax=candidate division WOR-3 bacterium TaxID=2052148 RepID=A0A660SLI4_UNCW3|nr:MAG: hypothetical protein DRP53_03545 [candidate division WOR-3 bacterium]
MLYLGKMDRPIPLSEIAEKQRIKLHYLEQIFIRLHRADLVKSKKGPGGGYSLSRSPGSIRIVEIMRALGEETAPVSCAEDRPDQYCARIDNCPLKPYWIGLKAVIEEYLNATLEEVGNGS